MFDVALIGLGKIGLLFDYDSESSTVLSHAKALYNHVGFSLKYAVDINPENRAIVKKMFPGVEVFAHWSELKEKKIDVVVIAVPTELHYPCLVEMGKNSHVKIFLVEKPLFSLDENYSSLDDSIRKKVVVNYIYKFHPLIKEISEKIVGTSNITKIICSYTKGIKHNGSHLIDLINHLFGNPGIHNVTIFNTINDQLKDDVTLDCLVNIRYKSSLVPIYFLGHAYSNYSVFGIDFYSDSGRVEFSNYFRQLNQYSVVNDDEYEGYKILQSLPKTEKIDLSSIMMYVYNYIYEQLRVNKKNISGFENEKNNFTMIKTIYDEVK